MKKYLFLFLFVLISTWALEGIAISESYQKENCPISEPFYLPISEIFPAQLRYASQNVQDKINKKIMNGDAQWSDANAGWEYRYNNGRSIFSIKESIPVVKAPFGYIVIDGHHDVLSSLFLEATWLPVHMIADLSDLSEDQFWDEAERLGWAYLYNLQGQRQIPPRDFYLLEDDPNRYFAMISARKCLVDKDLINSIGAEYPIWVKVSNDIPFIELKIADILWQNQIVYSYDMGRNPPEEFVEEARRVLLAAEIPEIWIIPERKHYLELSDEWKHLCVFAIKIMMRKRAI